MRRRIIYKQGISLVEGLIGVAIVAMTVMASLTTFSLYVKVGSKNLSNVQASYLLNETVENLFYLRDVSWDVYIAELDEGTKYYFVWVGTDWFPSPVSTLIDGKYDRYFIVDPVCRNASANIITCDTVYTGYDPTSVKATAYVGWKMGGATTTKSVSTYLFALYMN